MQFRNHNRDGRWIYPSLGRLQNVANILIICGVVELEKSEKPLYRCSTGLRS